MKALFRREFPARPVAARRGERHAIRPRQACARPAANAGSTCSSAARAVMYISGNETTAAAITVAGQEKTTVVPTRNRSWPIGPFLPKSRSRRKPTTVGGRMSGSNKTPSRIASADPVRLPRHAAAETPATNVIAVAVRLVAREIQIGEKIGRHSPEFNSCQTARRSRIFRKWRGHPLRRDNPQARAPRIPVLSP